jgi:hypothetical protein
MKRHEKVLFCLIILWLFCLTRWIYILDDRDDKINAVLKNMAGALIELKSDVGIKWGACGGKGRRDSGKGRR